MFFIASALAVAVAQMGPAPQGDFLKYLVGTWRVLSVDPSGGEDLHVCYSVRPFVGQKWISGVATSATRDFGSKDVWGYDGASRQLMRTVFDVSGTHAVVRSTGSESDVLVLEGDATSPGGSMRVRETIRSLSKNKFEARWEALRGGTWSTYALETATRVPSAKCRVS